MEPFSVAAAATELVPRIYKLARLIIARTQSFRKAPALLHELRVFGHDLDSGHLQLSVRFVETLLSGGAATYSPSESADRAQLRELAGLQLKRLKESLERTNDILEKCVGDDGQVNRWYYAMRGERALKREQAERRTWQADFVVFVVIVEKSRVLQPAKMDLTPDRLRVTTRNSDGFMGRAVPSAPHVVLASAEYKNSSGEIEHIDVLIEHFKSQQEKSAEDIARHLGHDFPSGGVLRCLGYRMDGEIQLVFRVPRNLGSPRSLESLIRDTDADTSALKPSVGARIALAVRLSKAVLSVHAANMVHKSIRPSTILLFKVEDKAPSSELPSLHEPFLTSWNSLRTTQALSGWAPETWDEDKLQQNLYRHPERYGLKVERRYHMGHDLYSLGVCLLEVGLWEPFLRSEPGSMPLSDKFCDAAQKALGKDYQGPGLEKQLNKADVVQRALLKLADEDLPEYMGRGYADIVLICLDRVHDLGELGKSSKDSPKVVTAHNDWVIQPLEHLLSDRTQYPDDDDDVVTSDSINSLPKFS